MENKTGNEALASVCAAGPLSLQLSNMVETIITHKSSKQTIRILVFENRFHVNSFFVNRYGLVSIRFPSGLVFIVSVP